MIAGHVAGSRGSREFYGIVLRRLDFEDETYERIGMTKLFESPSIMEQKIASAEAQVVVIV